MTKFIKKIYVYIDGCSKGNPGPIAVGIVIIDENNNILREFGEYIGKGTNQEAEYYALITALECLPDICMLDIRINSDSQLVINQMNRDFRIHKKHLQKLNEKARQKATMFRSIAYNHVPENNKYIKRADKLATEALNKFLKGN